MGLGQALIESGDPQAAIAPLSQVVDLSSSDAWPSPGRRLNPRQRRGRRALANDYFGDAVR
jgi:hypothetical protein